MFSEENFKKYFFDVRMHKPKKGQVIACFTSMADLTNGPDKKHLLDLLRTHNHPEVATTMMTRNFYATEIYSYQVPIAIINDLLSGLSVDEVLAKPYRYQIELFYYTEPENIPTNDSHWSMISIFNVNEMMKSEIVFD